MNRHPTLALAALFTALLPSCQQTPKSTTPSATGTAVAPRFLSKPLISHIYTADPAAHIFDGRIYLYPSHDIDAGVTDKTDGNHYAMRDYHVFSMKSVGAPVTDHGKIFSIEDVPWARRQLWAPDVAHANGRYYFYFPARDHKQVFRIGVAVGETPTGPFKPRPEPIPGAFSIDPTAFRDDDGAQYLYFGGLSGGQLQRWKGNRYQADAQVPADDRPAAAPRVARLRPDMLGLAEPAREIKLLDPSGRPLLAGDTDRRFFEGAWIHKYNGRYYFSYSTGTTHRLVYAIGDSPYGPFTYQGVLLEPVQGWTTHHSIVKDGGKWWLFYHDTELSGKNNLRNVKVTELHYEPDGTIRPINPFRTR
jgi:Glycosyl hydrolases family 43